MAGSGFGRPATSSGPRTAAKYGPSPNARDQFSGELDPLVAAHRHPVAAAGEFGDRLGDARHQPRLGEHHRRVVGAVAGDRLVDRRDRHERLHEAASP